MTLSSTRSGASSRTRPRSARSGVALIASLVVMLVMAACSSSPSAIGGNAGGSSKTVRIATTSSIGAVALLVMQGNGSLEKIGAKYHAKFTLNTALSSSDITTAFAAGEFDIMFNGLKQAPQLIAQGQDAVQLMSINSGGGVYIIGASKDQNSRGTDLKKWAGARIADTGVGSQTELWLDALMHGVGVTNYQKVPLSLDALYPAMLAGRVDAYSADAGTAALALVNKTGYIIANSNTTAAANLFGAPAPQVNMVTTHKFVNSNRALTQALVTGLMSTVRDLGKSSTTAATVQAELPSDSAYRNIDAKTFAVIWQLVRPGLAGEAGLYTRARFDAIVGLLRAAGDLKQGAAPPPTSMVDNSFAVQAYKALNLTLPPGVLK